MFLIIYPLTRGYKEPLYFLGGLLSLVDLLKAYGDVVDETEFL